MFGWRGGGGICTYMHTKRVRGCGLGTPASVVAPSYKGMMSKLARGTRGTAHTFTPSQVPTTITISTSCHAHPCINMRHALRRRGPQVQKPPHCQCEPDTDHRVSSHPQPANRRPFPTHVAFQHDSEVSSKYIY
jgi:hypothetical protein